MNTVRWRSQVLGLLVMGLLTGGCSRVANVMIKRTVSVTAEEEVCQKGVEVHLVGVSRFERQRWTDANMSEYWRSENPLRKSAKNYTKVIRFEPDSCKHILGKKDPIRNVWKTEKAEYLFVLADLRGLFEDLPGNADARRLELPAPDSARWGMKSEIEIIIRDRNVVSHSLPKPESK